MSEITDRIRRIIAIKRWARAKQKAEQKAEGTEQKKPSQKSNGDHSEHNSPGIVAHFIGVAIAAIIALQVTWPVIDSTISQIKNNTALMNDSGIGDTMSTMVSIIPLFFIVSIILAFIRPLM